MVRFRALNTSHWSKLILKMCLSCLLVWVSYSCTGHQDVLSCLAPLYIASPVRLRTCGKRISTLLPWTQSSFWLFKSSTMTEEVLFWLDSRQNQLRSKPAWNAVWNLSTLICVIIWSSDGWMNGWTDWTRTCLDKTLVFACLFLFGLSFEVASFSVLMPHEHFYAVFQPFSAGLKATVDH